MKDSTHITISCIVIAALAAAALVPNRAEMVATIATTPLTLIAAQWR